MYLSWINSDTNYIIGAAIVSSSIFEPTANHPVLLDDVHCIGIEDTLLGCSHSTIGYHSCGQMLTNEPSIIIAIQCQGALL